MGPVQGQVLTSGNCDSTNSIEGGRQLLCHERLRVESFGDRCDGESISEPFIKFETSDTQRSTYAKPIRTC